MPEETLRCQCQKRTIVLTGQVAKVVISRMLPFAFSSMMNLRHRNSLTNRCHWNSQWIAAPRIQQPFRAPETQQPACYRALGQLLIATRRKVSPNFSARPARNCWGHKLQPQAESNSKELPLHKPLIRQCLIVYGIPTDLILELRAGVQFDWYALAQHLKRPFGYERVPSWGTATTCTFKSKSGVL